MARRQLPLALYLIFWSSWVQGLVVFGPQTSFRRHSCALAADGGEEPSDEPAERAAYTRSKSLQAYIESLHDKLGDESGTDEGMACPGEPAVDPSRQMQANGGDSEYFD